MKQPLTATRLAELIYQSYSYHASEYDPRFWPLGLYPWDEVPSISKELLIEVASDLIDEMNKY